MFYILFGSKLRLKMSIYVAASHFLRISPDDPCRSSNSGSYIKERLLPNPQLQRFWTLGLFGWVQKKMFGQDFQSVGGRSLDCNDILTSRKVREEILTLQLIDWTKYDHLVVVIMSHGQLGKFETSGGGGNSSKSEKS
jgi:hypothetical protein